MKEYMYNSVFFLMPRYSVYPIVYPIIHLIVVTIVQENEPSPEEIRAEACIFAREYYDMDPESEYIASREYIEDDDFLEWEEVHEFVDKKMENMILEHEKDWSLH